MEPLAMNTATGGSRTTAGIGIVGAGPVGSLLALGCTRLGYTVTLYDKAPLVQGQFHNPQSRTLVLNQHTIGLLAGQGITLRELDDCAVIGSIRLRRYGRVIGSSLDKRHRRTDCFGLAVPQASLQQALNQAIAGVKKHSLGVDRIGYTDDGRIQCGDAGQQYRHDLLLVADGERSRLLELLGIAVTRNNLGQQAHVGRLAFADSDSVVAAQDTAYEVFDPQSKTTTVVVPQPRGATLVLLAPLDFPQPGVAWINRRLSGWLRVSSYCHQASWILRQSSAEELIRPRVAVLGNAACAMHPLAAQGLNLAYRQCASLFACMQGRDDPGEWQGLRNFEARALASQAQAQSLVSGLRLLASQPWLLSASLAALHLPGVRGLLARVGGGR